MEIKRQSVFISETVGKMKDASSHYAEIEKIRNNFYHEKKKNE